MTAENFETMLDLLMTKQPFPLFTVELVHGRKLEVDHPKAIAYQGGFAVFVGPGKVPVMFDHGGVVSVTPAPASSLTDRD